MEDIIKPTEVIHPFGAVEIQLFGRNGGKTDWTTRSLNSPESIRVSQAAYEAYQQINRVATAALGRYAMVWSPGPDFSARTARLFEKKWFRVGYSPDRNATIMRGVLADGCTVPKGSSAWLASADCPMIVMTNDELLVWGHGGYKSLVDVGFVKTGKPSRSNFSVIDSLAKEFEETRSSLRAFIALGIGPHFSEASLEEIEWLSKNLGSDFITDSGKINIVGLAKSQCQKHGIEVRTDGNDTFSDRDSKGEFKWWSYERATREGSGYKLKRNGVFLINR